MARMAPKEPQRKTMRSELPMQIVFWTWLVAAALTLGLFIAVSRIFDRMVVLSTRVKLAVSVLVFSALLGPILSPAGNASADSYRYRQQTGKETSEFHWTLKRDREIRLTAESSEDYHLTLMDSSLATRQWSLVNPGAATEITVRRERDVLLLNGQFEGKPVARAIEIDSAPWYQALSLSLRALRGEEKQSMEFWTLRPDNLEAHKLRAVRKGVEMLEIEGRQVAALRLEVSLTGMKAMFWRCTYWLRESDGVFLRYRGPSGPPGWPATEVRLIGGEGSK